MGALIGKSVAKPSHLIFHVGNTDETIAFYQSFLGASVADDHTFSAPSLDAIFGRTGSYDLGLMLFPLCPVLAFGLLFVARISPQKIEAPAVPSTP